MRAVHEKYLFLDTEELVDVTELKHYFYRVNVHRTNPPLFKRINDIAN